VKDLSGLWQEAQLFLLLVEREGSEKSWRPRVMSDGAGDPVTAAAAAGGMASGLKMSSAA